MEKVLTRPRRVTLTLSEDGFELLSQIAKSMDKLPGEVAREMVEEMMDGLVEMFGVKDGKSTLTPDQSLRRMFKKAMGGIIDAMDQLEEPK